MKYLKINIFVLAITFILALILGIVACVGLTWLENLPFYKNSGDIDSMRIPLIEPYKAVRLNNGNTWSVDLIIPPENKEIYYYLEISDVEKIAVENNLIMVYSSYVSPSIVTSIGEKVLHWFVIIPSQNIETGFETEEEFLSYIHSFGVEQPVWIDIDEAYKQFIKTGCLYWIPNCR